MDEGLVTIIVAIIGLITTILTAKFGTQYVQFKGKAEKFVDLINCIYDAAKDDKVTETEFQTIMDKAKVLVDKEST